MPSRNRKERERDVLAIAITNCLIAAVDLIYMIALLVREWRGNDDGEKGA